MISRVAFSLAAAVLSYSTLLLAQNDDAAAVEGMLGEIREYASGEAIEARFLANSPAIGEPLPNVTIFDDAGNPVNLRELTNRGRYSVLTLGCLT